MYGLPVVFAESIRLFRSIPANLKLAWLLLLAGTVALFVGLVRPEVTYDLLGLACVVAGLLLAILDWRLRVRRPEGPAAGFHGGLFVSALVSAIVVAWLLLPVTALVWLGMSLLHGFELRPTLALLQFAAVVFLYLTVTGIPRTARRTTRTRADSL